MSPINLLSVTLLTVLLLAVPQEYVRSESSLESISDEELAQLLESSYNDVEGQSLYGEGLYGEGLYGEGLHGGYTSPPLTSGQSVQGQYTPIVTIKPLPSQLSANAVAVDGSGTNASNVSASPPPAIYGSSVSSSPPQASYGSSVAASPPPASYGSSVAASPPPASYGSSVSASPPPASYGSSVSASPPPASYGSSVSASPPPASYGSSVAASPPPASYGSSVAASPPPASYGSSVAASPPPASYGSSVAASPPPASYGSSVAASPPPAIYGSSVLAPPPPASYGLAVPGGYGRRRSVLGGTGVARHCSCEYNVETSSWLIDEPNCREALYQSCDQVSQLPCNQLDQYYTARMRRAGASQQVALKQHISTYLTQDCSPPTPCSCAALQYNALDSAADVRECCVELSAHCQLPFTGLDCNVVYGFCNRRTHQQDVLEWVVNATRGSDCPALAELTSIDGLHPEGAFSSKLESWLPSSRKSVVILLMAGAMGGCLGSIITIVMMFATRRRTSQGKPEFICSA